MLINANNQINDLNTKVFQQQNQIVDVELYLDTISDNVHDVDTTLTSFYIDHTIISYCKTALFLEWIHGQMSIYYRDNPEQQLLLPQTNPNNPTKIKHLKRMKDLYDQNLMKYVQVLRDVEVDVPSQTQCILISEHLS